MSDVFDLVRRWVAAYLARALSDGSSSQFLDVDGTAYTVFAERFSARVDNNAYFAKVICVADDIAGFIFAGRTSANCAALYCSIGLTAFRGVSEFMCFELLRALAEAGVTQLNLGGAETPGLFHFKRKFNVSELRQSFDAEFLHRPE
jgi:hypothetical protein